ncbi:LIM domain protein, partial [Ostertagia ostertagi]
MRRRERRSDWDLCAADSAIVARAFSSAETALIMAMIQQLPNFVELKPGLNFHGLRHVSAICASCQQPVSGTNPGCTALNQIFHISCFKCKTCGKTLAGTSFYNIDDNPTCSDCYN